MESENFIFLSLFFSLIFALWGSTSPHLPNEQPNDVPQGIEGWPAEAPVKAGDRRMASFAPGNPHSWSFAGPTQAYFSNSSFFISSFLVFVANFVLTFFLLRRWVDSGYPPFSNLYESLLFLTWALLLFYFPAVGFGFPTSTTPLFKGTSGDQRSSRGYSMAGYPPSAEVSQSSPPTVSKKVSALIGMLLVSASLFIYTFATWLLPSEMKEIKPLVPALKSNWLLMHVSIMLLSYSALLAGSLLSILYLAIFYSTDKKDQAARTIGQSPGGGVRGMTEGLSPGSQAELLELSSPNSSALEVLPLISSSPGASLPPRMRFLTDVDSLSYRSLAFAFPLLTLGIISGAVWANEAWGSYWSWDPKETWALITWFIFSIYLHLRIQKAWEGEKAAWVGCIGFFVVWICYLGVNLLGKGLHSYGWWN